MSARPRGLERVAKFEFPFELNTVTRAYYERMASIETGQKAARQRLNKVVNDLAHGSSGPHIEVRWIDDNGQVQDKASDHEGVSATSAQPRDHEALESLVASDWPGLKVVPNMSVGASDGVFTTAAGMPTYTTEVFHPPNTCNATPKLFS